jgi:hypothetical protein
VDQAETNDNHVPMGLCNPSSGAQQAGLRHGASIQCTGSGAQVHRRFVVALQLQPLKSSQLQPLKRAASGDGLTPTSARKGRVKVWWVCQNKGEDGGEGC